MQRILLALVPLIAFTAVCPAALASDVVIDSRVALATSPAMSDGLDRRFATLPSIVVGRVRACRLDPPSRSPSVVPATVSVPHAIGGWLPAVETLLRLI